MDVYETFKTLLHTYAWNAGDKQLINDEWRALVSDIEKTFTKTVCHVKHFLASKGKQSIPFVIGEY